MLSAARTALVSRKSATVLFSALLLAGCAQQQAPGYYDVPHDSTQADAMQQAQGRGNARAPSQLQFGFGQLQEQAQVTAQVAPGVQETAVAAPAQADIPRPLREPRTFLGTVPCLTDGGNCPAQRITLTLAPSGEWRARTQFVGADARDNLVQQGCWSLTGRSPVRIALQTSTGATRGAFSFVNDNVLRVVFLDDISPSLEYRLSRQADIDPINELPAAPLNCR